MGYRAECYRFLWTGRKASQLREVVKALISGSVVKLVLSSRQGVRYNIKFAFDMVDVKVETIETDLPSYQSLIHMLLLHEERKGGVVSENLKVGTF